MTWKSLKTKGIPWRDYLSKEETARMKAIEAEEAKLNERLFQLKAERKPMESRARARYERAEISDGSRPPNGAANPVADHGRRGPRGRGEVRGAIT